MEKHGEWMRWKGGRIISGEDADDGEEEAPDAELSGIRRNNGGRKRRRFRNIGRIRTGRQHEKT